MEYLTKDEDLRLIKKAKKGDKEAIEKLIETNKHWILGYAHSYAPGRESHDADNLIQEGYEGLCEAIKHFDTRRNVRFLTYAASWVKKRVRNSARDIKGVIKIPADEWRTRRVRRAMNNFRNEFQREPCKGELVKITGFSYKIMDGILNKISIRCTSLDSEVLSKYGERYSLLDSLSSGDGIVKYQNSELLEKVRCTLYEWFKQDKTKPRQVEIFMMRKGFLDGKEYTLGAVGRKYNISREAVRKATERIEAKIRRFPDKLKDYWEAYRSL